MKDLFALRLYTQVAQLVSSSLISDIGDDGFFELLTPAGPQIPTQIVESVVKLED
jgi:hypothetical protein